ncbi:fructokinase-2-like isoform X2 [Magnolia sinica]|uniref:fructokinase-2-like isoform X2 n=1 Tax=Magnolia sinica TaxID=86752 RepID=UPI00265AB6E6|nr:fructokinase-2-like isoform X2 [Magnolia sinica]
MKCMYIDSFGTSLHRLGHFHQMAYLPILQRILAILAIVFLIRRSIRYLINWANGEMERLDDQIAESGMTISKKNVDGSNAREVKNPLVVSFGEMLIDFVPDVAGLSLAESLGFIKAPGGAPANVAVAIAKLGGRSAFIGKFGGDEFGHMLVDILKKNEVNGDGVCFDPDAKTGLAFVTLKSNREQEFMFYRNPSADMLLKESELNLDLIRQAKIFHYGSISLITDPCRSAHLAAMRAAKAAGVLLSYDPNVRLSLWPSADAAREGIKSIWTEADFIKVSDDEVAFLTNGDPEKEEVVLSLWFDGLKLLVVTDGEKGCRYFTKEFKGKVDGFSVETVDTTGAGDAFVGSLLVSLARNDSLYKDEAKLREALKLANACGAISTTQKGAIPALPNTSMAQELIAKSK